MGIFLIVLGIAIIVGVIITLGVLSTGDELKEAIAVSIAVAISIFLLYGLISAISINSSYKSYLDSKVYYDNLIAQYRGAITLYEDKATSLNIQKAAEHAFTDLKFQGYQEKMGTFILDLRSAIIDYNTTIIKKRIKDKNFFYSWYVIPPDPDMKTVNIIDGEQ